MVFAKKASIPTMLIGNINQGGILASLVGIKVLLGEENTALIKEFIATKFRGGSELLESGLRIIKEKQVENLRKSSLSFHRLRI